MGRIRSIKPEFPQSESMGRVSREARLFFILLWTIVDDSGRTRADSRLLASLLYPYDEDARGLIDGWIAELDNQGCLVRYKVEDHTYIEICKWILHQKIDKPTPSRIPPFDESSRVLAESSTSPRDGIGLDWIGRDRIGLEDSPSASCEKGITKAKRRPKERDELRDALNASFLAKIGCYAQPARENANLVRLADAIRYKAGDADPMPLAKGCVETFWQLHQQGKEFYAAFTPSRMLNCIETLWQLSAKRAAALDSSWMDA